MRLHSRTEPHGKRKGTAPPRSTRRTISPSTTRAIANVRGPKRSQSSPSYVPASANCVLENECPPKSRVQTSAASRPCVRRVPSVGYFLSWELIGIVPFCEGRIDHLYVLPGSQGRGIGTALLNLARDQFAEISLWTFQCSKPARRRL